MTRDAGSRGDVFVQHHWRVNSVTRGVYLLKLLPGFLVHVARHRHLGIPKHSNSRCALLDTQNARTQSIMRSALLDDVACSEIQGASS
jgi:hypothetical protein